MSRNKQEGRYAGRLNNRHCRTRGVNCTVGRLDVCLEIEMRRMRDASRLFNRLFGGIRSYWSDAPATSGGGNA